jgi:HSF-type DNA-binding
MCISRQTSNRHRDVVPFEQPSGGGDKRKNHRHITVQHHYHDHSTDSAPVLGTQAAFEDLPVRGSTAAPFPVKLYEMLERVEKEGFGHVVSWQPHGRCFVVHNTELFRELLPRYFTLSKIASFQRQLNLYGFMRLTRGLDKGGYYHEMFLLGKPFLIRRIQRVKVKGTGVRARSNPDQEPDFWTMPWVGQDAASTSSAVAKSAQHLNIVSGPSSSGASVVSHDDTDVSSTTSASRPQSPPPDEITSYTYTHRPQRQTVVDEDDSTPVPLVLSLSEDDFIMTGWGKPFYFLGSLPEEVETVRSTTSPVMSALPAVQQPTAFGMDADFMDLDLDDLVHDIIAVDQANDGNFLHLLERIIE